MIFVNGKELEGEDLEKITKPLNKFLKKQTEKEKEYSEDEQTGNISNSD